MAPKQDYYDVLGVTKQATQDEIKAAYRKMCMKWHPDRHTENKDEATEKFKEIGEAYQVLSDEKQKKIYDQFGFEGLKNGGGFQQSNIDPNELFRQMFGGNFSFSSFGGGDDDDDFGSFFQSGSRSGGRGGFPGMFRSGGFGGPEFTSFTSQAPKRKASEITHTINVTLEELYQQKTKKVKFSKNIQTQQGTRKEEKVLEFPLKAGVKQDSKIRFENEGDQYPGQIPADIVFKVNIQPHDRFQLEKQNLIMYKNITLSQALRSNLMVKVQTLDDRELKIPITDIVTPKYEKIVQGEGMPHPKGGRGDLIIRFNIEFPTYLSNDQKEKISKIL